MRFAYADPPYLGCCKLYDHEHGDDGRCWDDLRTHLALIEQLVREFPDGWALSLTSGSARHILPLCPADARWGPWCKTFGAFKRGVRPAYMWEPVIFWRGRNPGNGTPHPPPERNGKQTTPKDFTLVEQGSALFEPITLKKGLTGAKPEAFCEWVLDLLNVLPGDEVVDLFPGTGVMGRVARARTREANQAYQAYLERRVVGVLRREPASPITVAAAIDAPERQVRDACDRLAKTGVLSIMNDGRYVG